MTPGKKSKKNNVNSKKGVQIIEPNQQKSLNKKDILEGIDYPIFCFKHLQNVSFCDCKNHKFFHDFLLRLTTLSNLGWDGMRSSDKHAYGMGKIPNAKIFPSLPAFITPDVKDLTTIRANGNNLPFVGLQNEKIFHVIYIETKFGDIYDHGTK